MPKNIAALFMLLILLPASNATARQEVAHVIALRHTATATNAEGVSRTLASKGPIFEGDLIETGARGRIQILFTDNTIISLGRNGNLAIHKYLWEPERNNGALRTEVKEGIFRVMGGAITKSNPESFTTKTPAATIGIRGSMYAGRVAENGDLAVVFQGGRGIFIENEFGRVEIPTPGYGTNTSKNSPPAPPRKFSPEEMQTLTQGTSVQTENKEEEAEQNEPAVPAEEQASTASPELPPVNETSPVVDVVETEPAPELPPTEEPVIPWTPPTTGISQFHGTMDSTISYTSGQTETVVDGVEVFANWHNNTIIGVSWNAQTNESSVLFFGTIVDGEVANIVFFGGGSGATEIIFSEGSGTGSFSSSVNNTGSFSLSGSGYDYLVEPFDQPISASWDTTGEMETTISKESATGTVTWKGYSVGLSENMANINSNRHLTRNTNHDDFTLVINRDTGTVTGQMTTTDGIITSSIDIGTGGNSAYIHDTLFLALLDGTITNGSSTEPLKEHGNTLFTANPADQIAAYATWGYWETAYQNPATNEQYHNHIPGAMWIAGEPTSSTDLAALAAGNINGRYSGDVLASKIDANGFVSQMNGSFLMNVDFANLATANAFSGEIYLDSLVFSTASIQGTTGGNFIDGSMNGNGYTGTISGTLYGPDALSIGGNFSTTNGLSTYLGIYGGNR